MAPNTSKLIRSIGTVLWVITLNDGATATSIDPRVWSPRGLREFVAQGSAAADMAIGGVVLNSALQRHANEGNNYDLWCWSIEVRRVFHANQLVGPVLDACVFADDGAAPPELSEIRPGDDVRVFLVEAVDGTFRLLADRAIIRFTNNGRTGVSPDLEFADGAAIDRELETF